MVDKEQHSKGTHPWRNFRRSVRVTLLLIYLVIAAGAIVRATGSGMGCPDWPRCFGKWIPPTNLSQLPLDYRDKYAKHGQLVEEFNVYKTWTEYINRLCGALLGISALVSVYFSFPLRKQQRNLFVFSILILILIGFEGWLGKTVVDSNLAPLKITIHMVTALFIMGLCIYTLYRSKNSLKEEKTFSSLRGWMIVTVSISVLQVILGTQVREEVDKITLSPIPVEKDQWINLIGLVFPIHRSLSILIVALTFWVGFKLKGTLLGKMAFLGILIVVVEALVGIVITYWDFPKGSQPLHLILSTFLLGTQLWILSRLLPTRSYLG